MSDRASFVLKLGSWADVGEGNEPISVLSVDFGGFDEPEQAELIAELRANGIEPWEYKRDYSSYFANASADALSIIITAYPLMAQALASGTIEAFAERLANKILTLFRSRASWTISSADESVRRVLVEQAGLALPDLRQVYAAEGENGAWTFVYEDRRARERHMVVLDRRGVSVHVNLARFSGATDGETRAEHG